MFWLISLALSGAAGSFAAEGSRAAPEARPSVPAISIPAPAAPLNALSSMPALEVSALGTALPSPSAVPVAAAVSPAAAAADAKPQASFIPQELSVLGSASAQARQDGDGVAHLSASFSSQYDHQGPARDDSGDAPLTLSPSEAPGLSAADARNAPVNEPPKPPAPSRPAGVKRYLGFLPNLLTGLNMTSGLAAIRLLLHGGALPLVGGLIVLANVFDAFDGRAARWLNNHDPKGIHFDSLADIVSFGAAPALLIYTARLSRLGLASLIPMALFAFAGLYRLGRFNVSALAEASGEKAKSGFFTGLPIPGGAGVIVSFVLALPLLSSLLAPTIVTVAAVGVTLTTAASMVSALPYPNFKLGGSKAMIAPAAVGAIVAGALALAGWPLLIPAGLFGAYLATGPIIGLWRGSSEAFRRELRRKAFHVCGLLYMPVLHGFGSYALAAMGAFVALCGLFEFARIRVPWFKSLFEKTPFARMLREKEARRPTGFSYAALGIFASMLIAAIFGASPSVVAAGIAALFLGDCVSPLIGLRFPGGFYKVRGALRSWPGSLAAALAAFLIAVAFGFSPLVALGAAAAFSLVDTVPFKPDDNFWIPVAFSAALLLLTRL